MSGIELASSHPAMGEMSESGVEPTSTLRIARAHGEGESEASMCATDAGTSQVLPLLIDDMHVDPET